MRRINFAMMAFVLLALSSCEKEDEKAGNLNLRFKLVYGSEPMEMFKNYDYPVSNDKFFMTRLSFFLAELKIVNGNNEVLLKDIDYLNLTDAYTGGSPTNGFEYMINDVKAGEYTGLSFGIGVPKESNGMQPKDFPANSLLSKNAEYWSSWKSYIFFRPEGKIGLEGNAILDTDFALHLGADEAYRTINLKRAISIVGGKTTDIDVVIDMKKFFSGKVLHDINETQQIHSLFQMPAIIKLADNLVTAIN